MDVLGIACRGCRDDSLRYCGGDRFCADVAESLASGTGASVQFYRSLLSWRSTHKRDAYRTSFRELPISGFSRQSGVRGSVSYVFYFLSSLLLKREARLWAWLRRYSCSLRYLR